MNHDKGLADILLADSSDFEPLASPLGCKSTTFRSIRSLTTLGAEVCLASNFWFEADSSDWQLLKASPQAGSSIQVLRRQQHKHGNIDTCK